MIDSQELERAAVAQAAPVAAMLVLEHYTRRRGLQLTLRCGLIHFPPDFPKGERQEVAERWLTALHAAAQLFADSSPEYWRSARETARQRLAAMGVQPGDLRGPREIRDA